MIASLAVQADPTATSGPMESAGPAFLAAFRGAGG
jgi:hypothetical protein